MNGNTWLCSICVAFGLPVDWVFFFFFSFLWFIFIFSFAFTLSLSLSLFHSLTNSLSFSECHKGITNEKRWNDNWWKEIKSETNERLTNQSWKFWHSERGKGENVTNERITRNRDNKTYGKWVKKKSVKKRENQRRVWIIP